MHKYFAVFLALVACHGSLPTHGRKIKPLIEDTHYKPTSFPPLMKTSIGNVPSQSSSEKKVASFGDSAGADTNAFRPTTPGSSPGVGHRKFAGEDNNKDMKEVVVVQSPDVKVYVTSSEGSKNAFKPTVPGPSPGVGHVHQNKNGQLN